LKERGYNNDTNTVHFDVRSGPSRILRACWQRPSNTLQSLDELEEKIVEMVGSAKFVKKSVKHHQESGVCGD
jgi:hypothetical protein